MIQEVYVSYEVSQLLKEKGFNAECRAAYTNYGKLFTTQIQQYITNVLCSKGYLWDCTAPTHQMAMKWLREVHNKYIEICTDKAHNFKDIVFRPAIYDKYLDCLWESDNFTTYESAVEAALKYSLENLI